MSKYMSYICDICGKEIIGHSAQAVAAESAQLKLWPPCRILRKWRTKR